jgi:DNA polymerase-3 subunit epsilon
MKLIIFDTETTGLPKSKIIDTISLKLWPYIVQFSYIIYDTELNTILKIKDSIIKIPDTIIITKENSDIHGITNEISKEKGQDINLVIFEFIEDCNNSDLLIAHNMDFDINVLKVEILRQELINKSFIDNKNIDNKNIDNKNIDNKNIDNKNIDNKNIDNKNIDNKNIDNYLVNLSIIKKYCTMQTTIQLCNIKKINNNGKEFIKFPKLSELHEKLFNTIPKNLHNSLNDVIVCLRCYYFLNNKVDLLEINNKIKELFEHLL